MKVSYLQHYVGRLVEFDVGAVVVLMSDCRALASRRGRGSRDSFS